MARIVIIGNSGSGKTYLSQRLADRFGYPIVHLDAIFWEPGGFNVKRPKEIVYAEIATLVQGETWIVEGVFGELAQEFLPRADCLIWLDIDWATCSASLLQRGSESSKQLDAQLAEENFHKLLQWASDYWQRQDLRSQHGHASLLEQFHGKKVCLKTRGEVNDLIGSLSNKEVISTTSGLCWWLYLRRGAETLFRRQTEHFLEHATAIRQVIERAKDV